MSVYFPGTSGVKFEWEYPEPPVVNYQLARLEAYLANTEFVAREAVRILQEDMRRKFEEERDPDGIAWQELVQPEAAQIGILRRGSTNAAMFEAAISDQAWTASPAGVWFDAGQLPPYWIYHEQPSGGEQRLVRRAFVGPTGEAEIEIEAMAFTWLETGVDDVVYNISPVRSPATGRILGTMGQTSIIGGIARREIRDPATGRFVSTRPEFYAL